MMGETRKTLGRNVVEIGCVLAVVLTFSIVPVLWAGDPPAPSFAELLSHGEFSLARQRIEQAPADQRDALRWQLLQAQLAGGAASGAARTLGEYGGRFPSAGFGPVGAASAGRGGAVIADFQTLMDLIREVIDPDSWEETGDGTGRMFPFPLGVHINGKGKLRLRQPPPVSLERLGERRHSALADSGNRNVRRRSPFRKVSLTRLERHLALRVAQGLPPTPAMLHMAGLHRITHLFFYPETGDVVIAGPADGWRLSEDGRHVSVTTGEPTLWLDDWIEVWRNAWASSEGFYCSIEPRPANLRRAADWLKRARKDGIDGDRRQWAERLQQVLGEQDLVVQGIDARSRLASVIFEADYHMKRIGVGLEESVFGVPSYVELLASSKTTSANQVLRWWFTLADKPVHVSADNLAFQLPDQPVQLQSENPLIDAAGKPQSVGRRDPHNVQFAANFTRYLDRLAKRYPVYADLRNVMQWALVAAICHEEIMAERIDWNGDFFLDAQRCPIRRGPEPKTVQTVVLHRRFPNGRIITAVSGGVQVNGRQWRQAHDFRPDPYGELAGRYRDAERREKVPPEQWWWD